ncbi:hypothetical protein C5S31_06020 [ANME-1 cluster archaeon GoMg2]|nr:hypothetical protein [ANME-1 cluster archaeon GoMg2]
MTKKIDLTRWKELREEKIPKWIDKKIDKLYRSGKITN